MAPGPWHLGQVSFPHVFSTFLSGPLANFRLKVVEFDSNGGDNFRTCNGCAPVGVSAAVSLFNVPSAGADFSLDFVFSSPVPLQGGGHDYWLVRGYGCVHHAHVTVCTCLHHSAPCVPVCSPTQKMRVLYASELA